MDGLYANFAKSLNDSQNIDDSFYNKREVWYIWEKIEKEYLINYLELGLCEFKLFVKC